MKIRRLKRKHIDERAWNRCIENSDNKRVYALTWYLDAVCNNQWEALVYGNYDIVMPLPFTKKFGIKFRVQPIFCQQLGLFWKNRIPKNLPLQFISRIPTSLYSLNLNARNAYFFPSDKLTFNPNYVLKTNATYDDIWKNISNNHRRNIKKCTKQNIEYKSASIDEYIQLKRESGTKLNSSTWNRLKILLSKADEENVLNISAAYIGGELVSAICWIIDFERVIYLQAASNALGKSTAAAFGLVDNMIKDDTHNIIDFEGSANPGVARFYKGFGAKNETYPSIEGKLWNRIKKYI